MFNVLKNGMKIHYFSSRKISLQSHLIKKIKHFGPLSCAQFMEDALLHPNFGYYMKKDVFGAKGDFTTSPEISQIFGEMVGIWLLHEWLEQGSPKPFRIVEFGPGRGTLSRDIYRVFNSHKALNSVHFDLIEVSPFMRKLQEITFCELIDSNVKVEDIFSWHCDLCDVPTGVTSFYVAHEFLDALPIHKFQKHNSKWKEVLIGLYDDCYSTENVKTNDHVFRFIRAKEDTPIQIALLNYCDNLDKRNHVEISPKSVVLLHKLAERINKDGGAALFIDYGYLGDKEDTWRAFKKHTVCDPLLEPGEVDLTADVDFSFLKRIADESPNPVEVHGPVTQASFLVNMGIINRLEALISACNNDAARRDLLTGVEMLIAGEQMGARFNCFALLPKQTISTSNESEFIRRIPIGFSTE